MSSSVRVHCDGPDDIEVRSGRFSRVLTAGSECRLVISGQLSFHGVRPLTAAEAEMHGVPLHRNQPPDPFAEQ